MVEAAGVEPAPALFDDLRRRATLPPKPKREKRFGSYLLSSRVRRSPRESACVVGEYWRRRERCPASATLRTSRPSSRHPQCWTQSQRVEGAPNGIGLPVTFA